MGYYSKDFDMPSSELVKLAGGSAVAKGLSSMAGSLVGLADQKIADAEKDAKKKEKLAKLTAQSNFNKTYGDPNKIKNLSDEDLKYINVPEYRKPTVSSTTTDSEGNIITVMNDGSTSNTGVKGRKQYQKVGDDLVDLDTKKSVYSAQKPVKAPTQRTVSIGGKNVVQEYVGGKWVTSADAPVYNQSTKQDKTKGLKSIGGLSGAQISYARDNNMTVVIDGKSYVKEDMYNKLKEMDKIGNQEVN